MRDLFRDLRLALRTHRRQPLLVVGVVLTLALGLGASTAIFALLLEIVWSSYPAPQPDELFFVRSGTVERPRGRASYLDWNDYRTRLDPKVGQLEGWAIFTAVLNLPGKDGGNLYTIGEAVSPGFFDTLYSLSFVRGRAFLPAEHRPGGPLVAVIDEGFWQRRLGGDPEVLGRRLLLNGQAFTIVGVVPRNFKSTPFQVYIPLPHLDTLAFDAPLQDRGRRRMTSLLRLAPGATRQQAETHLAALAAELDSSAPLRRGARHMTLMAMRDDGTDPGGIRTSLIALAGAVASLLLLACANVANLLLARAAGRRREIAIYAAMGASRWRIARRLLTESWLLALAGGALGLVFGKGLDRYLQSLFETMPVGMAIWSDGSDWLGFDGRVIAFNVGLSLLIGGLFGLAPLAHAWHEDLALALKGTAQGSSEGTTGSHRFGARQILVTAQVLISTVLLLGAGLLARNLHDLYSLDVGYTTEAQVLAAVAVNPPRDAEPAAVLKHRRRLLELARQRLESLPGIESATAAIDLPGSGYARQAGFLLPEHPEVEIESDVLHVGNHFFETFDIPILRGRPLNRKDVTGGSGAAVVNEAFAARYWPGQEPLGRTLTDPTAEADTVGHRFTVVGVAPDIRHASRLEPVGPLVYLPLSQSIFGTQVVLVARAAGSPQAQLNPLRKTLTSLHSDFALVDTGTYGRQLANDLFVPRLNGHLASLLGVSGLGLACLGLYSVMRLAVSSRRRELGIRLALGASPGHVVRLVLGEAGRSLMVGVSVGLGVGVGLARLLTKLLHGITPYDPWTFLGVPVVFVLVGLMAAWLPARQAGQIEPTRML